MSTVYRVPAGNRCNTLQPVALIIQGVRLLDEWFYFDRPEPRLGAAYLMRYLPPLAKGAGIYHYQLGNAEGRR